MFPVLAKFFADVRAVAGSQAFAKDWRLESVLSISVSFKLPQTNAWSK